MKEEIQNTELRTQNVVDDWEEQTAKSLLKELDEIKRPGPKLQDWKIRAQTFLTFSYLRDMCRR